MSVNRRASRVSMWVGFVLFVLVLSLASINHLKDHIGASLIRGVKVLQQTKMERRSLHHIFKLGFVSKRRVPNGPDPIHNRRIESTKLPRT